jgi:hypothetical protein
LTALIDTAILVNAVEINIKEGDISIRIGSKDCNRLPEVLKIDVELEVCEVEAQINLRMKQLRIGALMKDSKNASSKERIKSEDETTTRKIQVQRKASTKGRERLPRLLIVRSRESLIKTVALSKSVMMSTCEDKYFPFQNGRV